MSHEESVKGHAMQNSSSKRFRTPGIERGKRNAVAFEVLREANDHSRPSELSLIHYGQEQLNGLAALPFIETLLWIPFIETLLCIPFIETLLWIPFIETFAVDPIHRDIALDPIHRDIAVDPIHRDIAGDPIHRDIAGCGRVGVDTGHWAIGKKDDIHKMINLLWGLPVHHRLGLEWSTTRNSKAPTQPPWVLEIMAYLARGDLPLLTKGLRIQLLREVFPRWSVELQHSKSYFSGSTLFFPWIVSHMPTGSPNTQLFRNLVPHQQVALNNYKPYVLATTFFFPRMASNVLNGPPKTQLFMKMVPRWPLELRNGKPYVPVGTPFFPWIVTHMPTTSPNTQLFRKAVPRWLESKFRDTGVITPEEFVAAGDHLVHPCPTWQWATGDESRSMSYPPRNKQFLIARNVLCSRRCKQGSVYSKRDDQSAT
uniref:Ubiquitin-like-conjugating enzyme ATG3 n=1 Tax=Timema shepardi TaxID=629360 RepID=A0A7R9B371_TIMSH|nr:unnamed protein product [Timema shepardi]